jgi:integrase/recombinase XerD
MDKDFDMPDFSIICPDKRKVAKAKRKPYQHVLSCEQVVELLNAYRPKRCHEDIWPRDKAILTMYLLCSVRNSELRYIRPCDLDYTNSRVFLMNTKGGEERYAAFPKTAQKAVDEYLSSGYRPTTASDTDPLFGVVRGSEWGMFDRVSMSTMIERKVKKIIEESGIRSHALRHASASFLLTKGAPIDVVQTALGHKNLQNTMIYAKRIGGEGSMVADFFNGLV